MYLDLEEFKISTIDFEQLFNSNDPELNKRDKFLSRLFGIFSEEIVKCWCKNPKSPYTNLGRPTLRTAENKRGCTLDFTFESNEDNSKYIVELKCELERNNYKYLKLKDISQLKHHQKKKAFDRFVKIAKNPKEYIVTRKNENNNRKKIILDEPGAILVWGSITESGRTNVINEYGFKDVLSLEKMISDLIKWDDQDYHECIKLRSNWSQELFNGLNDKQL
jgi:hypothetical protein